jgi:hypothetical protein
MLSLRNLAYVALTVLLAGCMSNPYVTRKIASESGEERVMLFAYGNYCGPDHPIDNKQEREDGRLTDLQQFWPPVDDVDKLCYAHDACYQNARLSSDSCDWAFYLVLQLALAQSEDPKCYNLMHDMQGAFEGIVMPGLQGQYSLGALGSAISSRATLEMTKESSEFPIEGECPIGPIGQYDNIIDTYMLALIAYLKQSDKPLAPISIPGGTFEIARKEQETVAQ